MIGPGKYDDEATIVRERTKARGVIVIVLGGDKGNGFAVQSEGLDLTAEMPAFLRAMADQIEADLRPPPAMTRAEHLAWCKKRALEYLDTGDLLDAVTSMGSDLAKHPELGCNPHLALLAAMRAQDGDERGVREWIEGFR